MRTTEPKRRRAAHGSGLQPTRQLTEAADSMPIQNGKDSIKSARRDSPSPMSPSIHQKNEKYSDDKDLASNGLTSIVDRNSALRGYLKFGNTTRLEGLSELPLLKLKLTNINVSLFARKSEARRAEPNNSKKVMRDM